MLDHRIPEPFHAGELRAQQLAGGGPAGAPIRSQMPDQHRAFFPLLPFLCVAVADATGWPLATVLTGAPGFLSSTSASQLQVAAAAETSDPAAPWLIADARVGLLGIDLSTRRRNRANGRVVHADALGMLVDIHQSFGNCPKFIRARRLTPLARKAGPATAFGSQLPAEATALIAGCDTMFVATSSGGALDGQAGGLDISHRGGPGGFLRLDGEVLTVPDYAGNRYFNTLGNLLVEPRASLLMVDFGTGDILQLQGVAEVAWHKPDLSVDPQPERTWSFRIVRGWLRRAVFPLSET